MESRNQNVTRINDIDGVVSKFCEYCRVDERLEPSVVYGYKYTILRFLKRCDGEVSTESVRAYLSTYLGKMSKTYNNQLCGLRAFVARFLGYPELMEGFKKAYEGNSQEVEVPSKEQIRRGFEGLSDDRERAIYLFYATTGVRLSEGLKLNRFEDVDYELRAVKSKHSTRTKKAGVAFYNEECDVWLRRYLASRKDESERLFRIGYREFLRIWKKASEAAEVKIRPQIMRRWHSTQLGELGVPDRYVDIFQGRAPKNVLAKCYTGNEIRRLKEIYEKARLRVLS